MTNTKSSFTRSIAALSFAAVLASCGSSTSSSDTTLVSADSVATTMPGSSTSTVQSTSITSDDSIVNTWVGSPIDTTQLPIGTSQVSLSSAKIGGLFSCSGGNPNGQGAGRLGPWINEAKGTWDMSKKAAVQGSVSWPMATYSEVVTGNTRKITSNGLPVNQVTGVFPISSSDPAYAYDGNPNSIASSTITVSLAANPTKAAAVSCLGKGRVGILKNGVSLFASLDAQNRDAIVYETQDKCDGHPQQQSVYHYHDVPSCIRNAATGSSTVVGFAQDGFPIVVERNAKGELPTNVDLDKCHGRTSKIELDGKVIEMYHYSTTYEFPYFIGCYTGTPIP